MGRTYKRNDPHNSNKPKTLREKRLWNSKQKHDPMKDKHPQQSAHYEDET